MSDYQGFFPPEEKERGCDVCPLRGKAIVPGSGPREADILILGEAPGEMEEKMLSPFVGKSGQHLNKTLRELDINRKKFRIRNVINCRPTTPAGKNRKPKPEEIWACSRFWEEEIEKNDPKVILLLGGIAAKAVLGSAYDRATVRDLRDGLYQYRGRWVIVSYHPSFLMRLEQSNPSAYPHYQQEFEEDIQLAMDLVEEDPPDLGPIVVANDPKRAKILLRKIQKQKYTAVDIEYEDHLLLCIGFSFEDGEGALVIPIEHPESKNFKDDLDPGVREEIIKVLEGEVRIIGQNFNDADRIMLEEWFDCQVRFLAWDTMFGSYIENHRKGIHKLEMIAARFAEIGGYSQEIDHYLKKWSIGKDRLSKVPIQILGRYNGGDCIATHRSMIEQKNRLDAKRRNLTRALTRASLAIAEMRHTGIEFDLKYSKELEKEYRKRIEESIQKTKSHVSDPRFDPRKAKLVGKVIYETLRLQDQIKGAEDSDFKTPSGEWSTADEGPLKIIRETVKHPFLEDLFEFRDLDKDLGTYLIGLQNICEPDHRIRAPIYLHGTDTGRCSARLHNVKNFSALGKYDEQLAGVLWNQFIAGEGNTFIKGDYSQIELRMMTEMSGDPELLKIYQKDGDLHEATRTWVFGKKPRNKDVAKEQRKIAKNVNFGMCFGLDEDSLYDYLMKKVPECGLTKKDVRKFHRAFFEVASRLREWQEETKAFAHENGYVVGHFGRIRRLDMSQGKHAENQAINSPIQGSAHDVLIAAMIRLVEMKNRDFKILLDHHDALICQVPERNQVKDMGIIHKAMMNPELKRIYGVDLVVPLKVDLEIGDRLGTLSEVPF